MTDNYLVFASVLLRSLCVLAAIAGVVYLAYHQRDGWGWLIFLAVVLGSYSLTTRAQSAPQPADVRADQPLTES